MYSKESYGRLLQTIVQSGYRIVDFATLAPDSDERQVILRHDVDFIPRLALEMAEIDTSCGIDATFFFLVRSHAYNLFSPANLNVLDQIERYGHTIALHCALPPGTPERDNDLVKLVEGDFALGQAALPRMARLFAWHTVPPSFFEQWRRLSVPGLANAYDDRYFSDIAFLSDSNARRSPEELQDIFRRGVYRHVQLLLHPVIWMCGGTTMMEVLSNAWEYFVREIEVELSTNGTYRRQLPHGFPASAVRAFAATLLTGDGVPQ